MPKPNIHIFKAGTRTAMSGEVISFSEADLAASAQAYNPSIHEAPLVVGHPRHDAPAYGWVQALEFGEDGLTAIPYQVDPAFAEMYAAGRFKKVSASFYRPNASNNPVPGVWYLRHVGFLGAQPPAVKGLRPAEFADGEDCVTVEFGESDTPLSREGRGAGGEGGDADPNPAPSPQPSPARGEGAIPTPAPEDTAVTPEEAARLAQENADLKARLDAAIAAQAKAALEAIHEKNAAFAEKLASEARIPADSVPLVTAALDFAQAPDAEGQVVAFGEGDEAKPLHQALRDLLAALPPRVEFGELATKDRAAHAAEDDTHYAEGSDPDRIEADKKIRAHMRAHNVDYFTAARAVLK
ncbi:MAG: peptidase [Pseudomonadota bacterium]